jgi:hypothetical protein
MYEQKCPNLYEEQKYYKRPPKDLAFSPMDSFTMFQCPEWSDGMDSQALKHWTPHPFCLYVDTQPFSKQHPPT